MSSREHIQGTPVTDVDPPNKCETWKSAYALRLTSKKTGETFDYFARAIQGDPDLQGPDAFLYALVHAYKMTKADELRNKKKQVTELAEGSKLCIVGAGWLVGGLAPAFSE